MRAGPARRDPAFRGIDTDALGHLIKQVKDASSAIKGWLDGHPLPPEVPRTGVRMATEVDLWATGQLGMLMRRRNYALTHPDHVHEVPGATTPRPGSTGGGNVGGGTGGGTTSPGPGSASLGARPPRRTVPSGAGPDLGNFPTQRAAAKAAAADVLAFRRTDEAGKDPPDEVWRHLRANADDPDYSAAFYTKLGPDGTADLITAAHHDKARLKVISESLGTGSHHFAIDEKWLRTLFTESGPRQRDEVAQVLADADLDAKADDALDRLRHLDVRPIEVSRQAKVG
jgi:hypothetical protein